MNVLTRATCAFALAFAGAFGVTHAGTQINGTRVIYPADEREVSVSLINNDSAPRLLQAWVDSGDPTEKPSDSKAPFMVTPPMSRVDPGKGQTFRLMYTGSPLPTDRESVFWFNVLEVPPRPKAKGGEDNNYLQFAIRTRIKIFFRPKGLAGNPLSAIEQLTWRVTQQGKGFIAECTNNSPFNVSFSDVSFKSAPEAMDRTHPRRTTPTSSSWLPARATAIFRFRCRRDMPRRAQVACPVAP